MEGGAGVDTIFRPLLKLQCYWSNSSGSLPVGYVAGLLFPYDDEHFGQGALCG